MGCAFACAAQGAVGQRGWRWSWDLATTGLDPWPFVMASLHRAACSVCVLLKAWASVAERSLRSPFHPHSCSSQAAGDGFEGTGWLCE